MEITKTRVTRSSKSLAAPEPQDSESAMQEESSNLNGENEAPEGPKKVLEKPEKDKDQEKMVVEEEKGEGNKSKDEESLDEQPPLLDKQVDIPEKDTGKSPRDAGESTEQKEEDEENKPKLRGKKRKAADLSESEPEDKIKQENIIQMPDESDESQKLDTTDDSLDTEMDLPAKQTFGKGKRARVPNRKYSDLNVRARMVLAENGERFRSDSDSSVTREEPPSISQATTSTSGYSSQGSKKSANNLKDPKYLKPCEYGWKIELVFRGTNDSKMKRNSDVYYFSPDKKKLRSMREVIENLKNKNLTVDNFTFFKESLGINDPEKEIIRNALKRSGTPTLQEKIPTPKIEPKVESTLAKGRKSKGGPGSKVTSPKVASPAVKAVNTRKTMSPKLSSPKLVPIKEEIIEPKGKATTTKRGAKKMEKVEDETPIKAKTTATRQSKTFNTRNAKRVKLSNIINSASDDKNNLSNAQPNHFQNLAYGYNTILQVFQYLKVQDLLRAGCVCTMWRDVMSQPALWKTVRMKNSQVHSFEGLANTLKKHGTRHLDLRKVLLPTGGDEIWPEFSRSIQKVDTLRRIELCRCPASVVESLAETNPNLELLNAVTIKCETLDLRPFKSLHKVKELRLKSTMGFAITSNLDSLKEMRALTHLSLTSVKSLDKMNLGIIGELTELESLDLGECTDFPKEFGEEILIKLTKLEKLRLEKGQGDCHTFEILEAVRAMPKLEQLELVNFDIKTGFDKALGACHNIKKLLLIPTYISQSATTNHMLLGGVVRLQKTLSHFVWGVTLELLRVTELFIDQCEEMEKKERKESKVAGSGDFIPVLKPSPLVREKNDEIAPAFDPPQVEIFHLYRLQKLLMTNLPNTRVKILKIPFHATWRQSITDTVN